MVYLRNEKQSAIVGALVVSLCMHVWVKGWVGDELGARGQILWKWKYVVEKLNGD